MLFYVIYKQNANEHFLTKNTDLIKIYTKQNYSKKERIEKLNFFYYSWCKLKKKCICIKILSLFMIFINLIIKFI